MHDIRQCDLFGQPSMNIYGISNAISFSQFSTFQFEWAKINRLLQLKPNLMTKLLNMAGQPRSLLSCPLDKCTTLVKVYFQKLDKRYKVFVDVDNCTVTQTIIDAVRQLNQGNKLALIDNAQCYELFAAKKDGSKNLGLPALDPAQYVTKTQIKRFFLMPAPTANSQVQTKDTISSIKSEYNMNLNKNKEISGQVDKNTAKKFNFCGCFCLGE